MAKRSSDGETQASRNVKAMMGRKVDFAPRPGQVGTYLDLHEKLAMDLAREYQREEDWPGGYVCISWKNQERAQSFFNEHGFMETLEAMTALRERNDDRYGVRADEGEDAAG